MASRTWPALDLLLWAALLGAGCGQKPPAPAPPVAAHAAATAAPEEPADEPPPSADPFEQPDDVPVDSKAILQEMRHDCCTELPASEIEQHRAPER